MVDQVEEGKQRRGRPLDAQPLTRSAVLTGYLGSTACSIVSEDAGGALRSKERERARVESERSHGDFILCFRKSHSVALRRCSDIPCNRLM